MDHPARRRRRLALPRGAGVLAAAVVMAASSPVAGDEFAASVRPLVARYCLDCHSGAEPGGGVELARFATAVDVAADPEPWRLAADQLRAGAMPPVDAPQPSPEEREALRGGLRRELLAAAARADGDPGPVVLRRLSNVEYTASLRDLTGVESLDPARDLPADGAAGEGFTNVGQALLMSPVMVEKYLDAAKEVAAHAVLTPGGIRFSPSTTRRDWTEELLASIRGIYARTTENSGGTAVNLQGIAFDTNAGGRLPLIPCLAASIEEREGLLAGTVTPAEAAARHGVSPRYLAALVAALVDEAPCLPLDAVRAEWRRARPEDAERLAGLVRPWQDALWAFNTIGHIGKRDGPKAWQTPVVPLAERHEIRLRLPKDAAGPTIPVWFAAGGVGGGAASDVALFEAPRIVAAGRPDLPLADLRGIVASLAARRARLVDDTAEVLALAATVEGPLDDAALATLAAAHGLEPAVVSAWLRWLGTGRGDVRLEGHIEGRMEAHADHPSVKGWTGPEALTVIANPSAETVRVPGTMGPQSLAVHPTPTRRVLLAWKSPVSGVVTVRGTVQHAHPACGNGVTWGIEARRGGSVVRLAAGRAQGDATVAVGPFADLAVRQGDLVVLWVGPGGRDHSCDLTAVEVVIEQPATPDGAARRWSLGGDVVPDILAGNPHADAAGTPDVWHFVSEPDGDESDLAVVPRGSLLDRWRSADDAVARRTLADALETLLRDGPGDLPTDAPDRILHGLLTSLTGPLLGAARADLAVTAATPEGLAAAAPTTPDPALFGGRPDGGPIEPGWMALAAPGVVRVDLPAELVAGGELVTTATVAEPAEGGRPGGIVQARVLAEEPRVLVAAPDASRAARGGLWSDGSGPHLSANPILVRDPARRAALEAQFDTFRATFPAALCYTKIVPVDEVVTLTLYHREDHELARLVLSDAEREELDRLWRELHFVSGDALQLVDAYEQLWQYATQDADPSAFEPLRQPILDRAAAHRADLVAAEPAHLEAVLAWARRAWRRPLAPAEQAALRDLYARLRADGIDHDPAVRTLLARVLVAPAFLYHLEEAPPGERAGPVDDHALAARLSAFLWSSIPDAELSELADAGRLHDPAILAGQVERMLRDDRVARLARHFGCQWLHIADIDTLDEKSPAHFPEFAPLRGSMQEEAVRFFTEFFRADRPADWLLDADETFVDAPLAAFYGVAEPAPADAAAGAWRRLDGMQARGRGGMLGLAAVLARQSGASRTSPILKGTWLTEVVLGRRLPKPPPGIPILPEVPPEGLTERQLTALHSTLPACASCHRSIDPWGFALEGFDAIGRSRTVDSAGLPVDTRAAIPDRSVPGATRDVEGLAGLRAVLLENHRDEFVRQFSRKLLGYALGRSVLVSDEPLLERLEAAADRGAVRMVQLIVDSPQFRGIRGRDLPDPRTP